MATWDNHDYGTHNGGAEFELQQASKRIFLDFFGEPQDSARQRRAGIYDANVFGPEGRHVADPFAGGFKRRGRVVETF